MAYQRPINPPTPRQEEVLAFIKKFMKENLFPPTLRLIAGEFGFASMNALATHLRALVRKGRLRRVRVGTAIRYLPVVPPGTCPYCGGHE